MRKKQKGFTLIELLIVIVIIGVLAGVLIAVINPFRQQNRARNAAIRAGAMKVAFAINTARAGLGKLPDEVELDSELENIIPGSGCDTVATLNCTIKVSGIIMPETCVSGGVYGHSDTAGSPCVFGIVSIGSSLVDGMFRIAAKQFKLDPADAGLIYVFDSTIGMYSCPADTDYTSSGLDLTNVCTEVNE